MNRAIRASGLIIIAAVGSILANVFAVEAAPMKPDEQFTSLHEALEHPDKAVSLRIDTVYGVNELKGHVPPSIGRLSHLRELVLTRNDLKALPYSLSKLASLEKLDLGMNKFERIPPEVLKLPALKELSLYDNPIRNLVPEIKHLPHLQSLDITKTSSDQKSLPPEIGALKELRALYAANWWVDHLPAEITQLESLEELTLASHPLKDTAAELKRLAQLPRLQSLTLAGDSPYESEGNAGLKALPPEVAQFKHLRALRLPYNELSEFPKELLSLTELEELDLSHNYLKHIPDGITALTHLKQLKLDGNQLPKDELERLRALLPNCTISG